MDLQVSFTAETRIHKQKKEFKRPFRNRAKSLI